MSKTKEVCFAYPTSPNAERFGYRTGCWCVEVSTNGRPPVALAAYDSEAMAIEHAERLPMDWSHAYKSTKLASVCAK